MIFDFPYILILAFLMPLWIWILMKRNSEERIIFGIGFLIIALFAFSLFTPTLNLQVQQAAEPAGTCLKYKTVECSSSDQIYECDIKGEIVQVGPYYDNQQEVLITMTKEVCAEYERD